MFVAGDALLLVFKMGLVWGGSVGHIGEATAEHVGLVTCTKLELRRIETVETPNCNFFIDDDPSLSSDI